MQVRRLHVLIALALAGAAPFGCNDPAGELDGRPDGPGSAEDGPIGALAEKVTAGPPMTRNLSNREYLSAVSDLIGEKLSLDLTKSWTATTQFSGFDAVPWTNMDTKAIRDRAETLEQLLDHAIASKKVMRCSVTKAEELAYDGCAKSILEPLAKRAYGRPLAPSEIDSLTKRYEAGVALAKTALTDPNEIFVDGIRTSLGSVLLAPQFLTHIEAPPAPDFTGERDLDAYELASRLAFMFTGSIPDDELWSKAEDGSLSDPEVLTAQTKRLLDDGPDVFVKTFMGQWFDFRSYDEADPKAIESTMYEESWRTLTDVVKGDMPITAIVDPGFAYLNEDLAKHYNVVGTFSPELERVPTHERGGILQQGSWLTLSATPLKTSPIHRGRLVQDRLLCKVIPPPDSKLFEKIQMVAQSIPQSATVKERLEAHRTAGDACFGCHRFMDPIGLGLEGFDQHGRLRRAYADTGKKVETESDFLGKPFKRFDELNQMIAVLPDFHRCAAEKLAIYSVRRVVDEKAADDSTLLDYLSAPVDGRPPSVRQMILRLVTSKAFRKVHHGARS